MHHRGEGPLHFGNMEEYRKYLAYIHIHHKSKGHYRHVFIAGHQHHVCHHCGSPHHKTHEHHKMYKAAKGFHGYVEEPTYFEAGEHGRERVDITPEHKSHHEHTGIHPLGNLDRIMKEPMGFETHPGHISLGKAYGKSEKAGKRLARHESILGPDYSLDWDVTI